MATSVAPSVIPGTVTEQPQAARPNVPNSIVPARGVDRRWLDETHPIWRANITEWVQNIRRVRGGRPVFDELMMFTWEEDEKDDPNGNFQKRKSRAAYPNLPDRFLSTIAGHIVQELPEPDTETLTYGPLGKVKRASDDAEESDAELFHYNVDGRGMQGSQFRAFVTDSLRKAMTEGHIWQFCEGPATMPGSRADELKGQRPYWLNWRAAQVTNWDFSTDGRLNFLIARIPHRRPRLEPVSGKLVGNDYEMGYYLLTREGCETFGEPYNLGGFWRFDGKREPLTTNGLDDGPVICGLWTATGMDVQGTGEIPAWPLFYLRDDGLPPLPSIDAGGQYEYRTTLESRPGHDAMSRAAVTELCNIAVALMDLGSAAHFDAWDACMSMWFLLGADPDQHDTVGKLMKRSRLVSVPKSSVDQSTPGIESGSNGAVAAEVIGSNWDRLMALAQDLAAIEATGDPAASGVSKQVSWSDKMATRLSQVAENLETALNTGLYNLCRRWGKTHQQAGKAFIRVPRRFKLVELLDAISAHFDLELKTGLRSPTLGARAMVMSAERRGLLGNEMDQAKISDEYTQAVVDRTKEEAAQRALMADARVNAA
jgi:hypothetical protein